MQDELHEEQVQVKHQPTKHEKRALQEPTGRSGGTPRVVIDARRRERRQNRLQRSAHRRTRRLLRRRRSRRRLLPAPIVKFPTHELHEPHSRTDAQQVTNHHVPHPHVPPALVKIGLPVLKRQLAQLERD